MITVTTTDQGTQTAIAQHAITQDTLDKAVQASISECSVAIPAADTGTEPMSPAEQPAVSATTMDVGAELTNFVNQLQEGGPTEETVDFSWLRGEGL